MQSITNSFKNLTIAVVCSSLLLISKNSIDVYPNISYHVDNAVSVMQPFHSLWSRMSSEFQLNHLANTSAVKNEIRKILTDREKLNQILRAATPYMYYIYQQTQLRKLPAELALVPIIESEFNPNNRSNRGALGLWQLMPGTAHDLGVKVTRIYDGRRNVISSTKAALAYFNDLGHFFNGNWYLAIAAYNSGQGKVRSAVRRANSKDFFQLKLPKETRVYVPKLLALAEILKNPAKYGIQLPPLINQPYFTAIEVKHTGKLTDLAHTLNIDINTLHTLNPDLKHTSVLKKINNTLLIPV